MVDVSSALGQVSNGGQKSATSSAKLSQDYTTFLRLLTTQMQNQDPLNPMDSSKFTDQLVSFSAVEQQIQTNQTLNNLLTMSALNMTSIGIGFIGLDVDTKGSTMKYAGTGDITFGYEFPEDKLSSSVKVFDKDGVLVFSTAGEAGAGKHSFKWDGTDGQGVQMPTGMYRVQVVGTNEDKTVSDAITTVPGRVDGIESGENGAVMVLIGDQKVPITDVTKARQPGT